MKFTSFAICLECIVVILMLISIEGNDCKRIRKPNFAPDVKSHFKSLINTITKSTRRYWNRHIKNTFDKQNGLSGDSSRENDVPVSEYPYLSQASADKPEKIARRYLESELGLTKSDYEVSDSYTSDNGVTHIYCKQYHQGIEIENADANVNVDKYGRIVSFGESFHKQASITGFVNQNVLGGGSGLSKIFNWIFGSKGTESASKAQGFVDEKQAVIGLLKYLELDDMQSADQLTVTASFADEEPTTVIGGIKKALNGVPVVPKFMQTASGQLIKVWDLQMEMEDNWFHAHVAQEGGEIMGLMDWVSEASYDVYPLGVNDPEDGDRKTVIDPADKEASPYGWHAYRKKHFETTQGNNVVAQENLDGRTNDDYRKQYRPSGGKDLEFEFPMEKTQTPGDYLDAAITNLFYWNNVMHDLFYKYGFDEKSGNFQHDNLGKGGKGNDEVIANAQDGAGYNNANFASPPDGKNGKMRMYVWNTASPYRDGDMEPGIIIHEYGHGISTRLTGGPANSNCLGWGESGGMGEGWGDFWATILRMRPEYTRRTNLAMGSYAANKKTGIRKFVYSTDMKTNPSTYGFIKKFEYFGVHAKGEVWAAILYEMYWNLVDKNGFSLDWYNPRAQASNATDSAATGAVPAGNIVALQLTVDGLKLQPCRPSFVDARDAILQADEVNYGGQHVCELWQAFAKRGLGVDASSGGHESFSLPEECQ